jgi:biopolymer transport protein ExbD
MIVVPMSRKAIDVQLPDPTPVLTAQPDNKQIVLEIGPNNSFSINKEVVTKANLGARLHQIYDARPEKIIFIKGDDGVKYQDVILAMDAARGAGVKVIGVPPKVASVAVHALVFVLILWGPRARVAEHTRSVSPPPSPRQGPSGGGGERLRYVGMAAPPPPPVAIRRAAPPRAIAPPPPPANRALAPEISSAVPTGASDTAGETAAAGTGTGAAEGTGAGAGAGTAGAGGAPALNKRGARIASNLLIGVDAPARLRPFALKVLFEVDARGVGRILSVTSTRDDAYNRTLLGELAEIRFHPAELPDGTAVADTVALEWDF